VRAFGTSRRTLYRLFEPRGGFNAYLQKQRLHRAWDALRAPEQRHLAISEIAQSHGFTNPESFSRAFRSQFNLTPREARHLSASEMSIHRSAARGGDWSQWIRQIGS
jgi:AraC-like DNA-binding protein